ncbi:MAG: C40 family peptidase [Gemmatimonadaceae bacterium]|nr:C40 family peptidase [Gemmatimonadaceae bacterium]
MRFLHRLLPRRCRPGLALVLTGLLVALSLATPADAAAARPKPRRPAVSASRAKVSKARAGRSFTRHATRARATRGRTARRSFLATAPIVPAVAKATVVSDSAHLLRDSVVSLARQQLGTAYVLGAQTPGRAFDCSGLVRYVMSWINVRLPRTANEQAYTGIAVGRQLDRFKPGDLLTFGTGRRITHIAVYVGDGKYVHASRPGVGVIESVLNPNARRFRGAVRLVADASDTTTAQP